MTATTTSSTSRARPGRRARTPEAAPALPVPPLSPRAQFGRAVLVALLATTSFLLAHLLVLSSLQQRADQQRLYDRFRGELARGTAPVGAFATDGAPVALGAPVAYLEIPRLGLRQVVVEGTDGGSLAMAPGHRRDTVLPGQAGTSVVLGRRSSHGGPFRDVGSLRAGDRIEVTTGFGEAQFEVIGVRHEGDPAPEPPEGGRLVLVTADGTPFVPGGVLRVDADLVGEPSAPTSRAVSTAGLPATEQIMASDTTTLWALALWLQALLATCVVAVWAWRRWGRAQAWLACLPPMLLIAMYTAGEVARLFPNLL